jgi:putative membrane protein
MIATTLIALIAVLHLYILVLEMLLWETPRARKAFGTTAEFARATRVMAANQGLYNGFLAAGLLWALLGGVQADGHAPALFFLSCILIAGLYGAATASRRILFIQAVPALLALIALFCAI